MMRLGKGSSKGANFQVPEITRMISRSLTYQLVVWTGPLTRVNRGWSSRGRGYLAQLETELKQPDSFHTTTSGACVWGVLRSSSHSDGTA